ncbi:hypothetical protein [Microvirga aerophila]|uniref:Uncharacterized protein n=1 Tax=Microvirga aerophila TaxID=670291 RepID=A0A512BQ29_9HYPH|nr:hypothetical protein [Microvirga aerophila]GEO14055.1 hypothetical protein MAE02_17510 [Microvirga aerophila]
MFKHRLTIGLLPQYSKNRASFENFILSDVSKIMGGKHGRWKIQSHNCETTISFSRIRDLRDYEEHINSLEVIRHRKGKDDVNLPLRDICFVETTILRKPYYGVWGIDWLSAVESRKATLIANGHDPDDSSINNVAAQEFWDELQRHTVGLKLKCLGRLPTWSHIQLDYPASWSVQFFTMKDAITFKKAAGAKTVLKFTPARDGGVLLAELP